MAESSPARATQAQWLDRYVSEMGRMPSNADYLRAFVSNRGGSLSYSAAKSLLASPLSVPPEACDAPSSGSEPQKSGGYTAAGYSQANVESAPKPGLLGRSVSVPVSVEVSAPVLALRRAVSENRVPLKVLANDKQLKSGMQRFTNMTLERLLSSASDRQGDSQQIRSSFQRSEELQRDVKSGALAQGDDAELLRVFGFDPDEEVVATVEAHCGICLEHCSECVKPAGDLCVKANCEGWFCTSCLKEYYELTVDGARYSVPFMRCPGCKCFIRNALWQRHASDAVIAK